LGEAKEACGNLSGGRLESKRTAVSRERRFILRKRVPALGGRAVVREERGREHRVTESLAKTAAEEKILRPSDWKRAAGKKKRMADL